MKKETVLEWLNRQQVGRLETECLESGNRLLLNDGRIIGVCVKDEEGRETECFA